ncbi:metal-dependent transcriptional regulator [Kocuria oceani]|uniref:metal-dependent transcriptional regulator n=1 Tax=Kocuria oceani TaxID=988827 RepID=UPI00403690BC
MDLSEITPVAQDYLKAIWSATEWGDPPITTKGLATRMGTTAPNVTDTVKRLAAQGLIEYQPYKPVTLTTRGEQHAIAMVRRHRLLETFLVTTLGYPWEEVHDEAERLEHAVSDAMIERIDAQLGHPTADPHGDPIPTAQGRTRRPLNTTRLTTARPGRYEIVRLSDADPERLTRFRDSGLVPGGPFRVTAQGANGITGVLGNHHAAIDLTPVEAEAIWVTPSPTLNTRQSP